MSFDINEVLEGMAAAIKGTVSDNWDKVKHVAEQMKQNEKETLEMLASMRISGEITGAQFESRLADQKEILEADLLALKVLSTAIAQKAANAAIGVLEKAVIAAIGAVL